MKIIHPETPLESRSEGLGYLNQVSHKPGQLVMATYRTSDDNLDAILALGILDGVGPGHYTVLSVSGLQIISGIFTSASDIPDSSTLINGEVWLWQEAVTNDLYWVYLNVDSREIEPVNPEIYYRVVSLSDMSVYWVYQGSFEKVDNYYSRSDTDSLLMETLESAKSFTEETRAGIMGILDNIRLAAGLPETYQYPGTIRGAQSLADADRILQSRLEALMGTVSGSLERLGLLETELAPDQTGLTRLDKVWNWYDSIVRAPSYGISWEILEPGVPSVGTTVTLLVTYTWSYSESPEIYLGTQTKTLGSLGLGTETGRYVWIEPVTVTQGLTLEAGFVGVPGSAKEYEFETKPVSREITVSIGSQGTWLDPDQESLSYTVTFTGSGLSGTGTGTEICVIENNQKIYVQTQSSQDVQEYVCTRTVPEIPWISLENRWSEIRTVKTIWPVWYVIGNDLGNPELARACYPVPGQELVVGPLNFDVPKTLTLLLPPSYGDPAITVVPTGHAGIPSRGEFDNPGTTQYRGKIYNQLTFRDIGIGTYSFIIDGLQITE